MVSTLAMILLVPYFGWGIYALRLKYRFHEDLSLLTEAATLLGLVLFYAIEMSILRDALEESRFQYMMATLGLLVSGAALYGHMAISFSSRLIVEAVVPGPNSHEHRPRLGPAEALEKQKDFEGALQEYHVVARMFPKDHVVPMRIAQLHVQMGNAEEAVPWLQRAQKWVQTEDQALGVVTRLAEILESHLKRPDDARNALVEFLGKHPEHKEAQSLRLRLERIGAARGRPKTEALNALSEAPLLRAEEQPAPKSASWKKTTAKPAIALTALDEAPVITEHVDRHQIEERSDRAAKPRFTLEKIEDSLEIRVEEAAPTEGAQRLISLGLESMDDDPR